ncbi:demethoxyubiquinone hydroxylase family protein [Kordiimonas sp.]|uniref:demethoxyubiquinone hydroxylase family protein n=1 Tax=Kordiimonas sp. TaxID=1970157 RepID=UPI003A8F3E6A
MPQSSETILKVNHAGEYGAMQIYAAQVVVARFFGWKCVNALKHMKAHEEEHFTTFDDLIHMRNGRTCHAPWLWALGGFALGFFTALFGEKGIWTCTIAVERNVFTHLEEQLDWTERHDPALHAAVLTIIADEAAHRDEAVNRRGKPRVIDGLLESFIGATTNFAIWLSHRL